MRSSSSASPRRILVVLPNWVGDVVLATPVLAALRRRFEHERIGYLMRRPLAAIVAGAGWHDAEHYWPDARDWRGALALRRFSRQLRTEAYDTALLLTNAFRSALTAWLAGIARRVGYARDGRSLLLTERLWPLRRGGEFVPTPITPYYAAIAERVGCPVEDLSLRLAISPEDEAAGRTLKAHYGLGAATRYAVVNPGAAFGAAKCWLPERFGELCQRLYDELGLTPVVVGAAGEYALMRTIAGACRWAVCCENPPTTLGSLKVLIRDAALLVCNDTGPRHYGNALGIPTVTLFGPTHQAWTDTGYAGEIKLQIPVECGPCQLPRCPLDHRCMTELSTDMVMDAVRRIMAAWPPRAGDGARPLAGAGTV